MTEDKMIDIDEIVYIAYFNILEELGLDTSILEDDDGIFTETIIETRSEMLNSIDLIVKNK